MFKTCLNHRRLLYLSLDKKNAKEKILKATLELIKSEEDNENITIRQIAKKADVNIALINYHFQSKENLLSQVAENEMANIISQMFEKNNVEGDAITRLKNLLIVTADFAFKNHKIFKIAVSAELKQGGRNSCEMVIPLLKEIFENKTELELRIIALQLFLPCHYIVLSPDIYHDYLNTDFFDEEKRVHTISQMVDSILPDR